MWLETLKETVFGKEHLNLTLNVNQNHYFHTTASKQHGQKLITFNSPVMISWNKIHTYFNLAEHTCSKRKNKPKKKN